MPESDRTSVAVRSGLREPYARASMRPLESLIFLLPFVIAYEIGSIVYLGAREAGGLGAIRAERLLHTFFELFGVAGLALPPLLLVTILLVWHILEERSSRVRPGVVAAMAVESATWALPLLALAMLASVLGAFETHLSAGATGTLAMAWPSRLTLALGAGLYEELLFRLIGLALVHMLVVDLLRAPERVGRGMAVVSTAVAFALYHDPGTPGQFAYYALAGVFLGALYLVRGFGITAGAHAMYDAIVLLAVQGT